MLNVSKLKHFFENVEHSSEKEDAQTKFYQDTDLFKNIFNQNHCDGPITIAQAKLIKHKDTAQLALALLQDEKLLINIHSLCDPIEHCAECENEDSYFKQKDTLQAQWRQLKLAEAGCKQWRL